MSGQFPTKQDLEQMEREGLQYALRRRVELAAQTLLTLETLPCTIPNEVFFMSGYSVKMKEGAGGETLIVARATIEGERFVAFHSGPSHFAALKGFVARLSADELKWKADEFAR